MKKAIVFAWILSTLIVGVSPAHADAPCQPVAHDVTQIPNNIEHHTMLHSGAHTTSCQASTWAQVKISVQFLQSDGSWSTLFEVTSAPKWISPMCRTFSCRSASVVVDRNPCSSGTFRAVATASGATNIGVVSTITCYQDPQGEGE